MNKTISEEWLDKLKEFEGYRSKAYKCPAGVWTIGYGSTGPHAFEGAVIDKEGAERLLREDLKRFENCVNDFFKSVRLGQHQFDALVDFAFNCGTGALRRSTLAKKVLANPDNIEGIAAEFRKWNKGGGKVLNGLVRRREAEIEWYKKDLQ